MEISKTAVEKLFSHHSTVPAVIKDADNGKVLMVGYMNETALRKTVETGYTYFCSRSRQGIWQKGAHSGNVQRVKRVTVDCDYGSLLIRVEQKGTPCKTGHSTCFHKDIWQAE